MERPEDFQLALRDVHDELADAVTSYGPMASAHEGYAVILEELEELKMEVFKKPVRRSTREMRQEACQVAAMAVRFMVDVCGE